MAEAPLEALPEHARADSYNPYRVRGQGLLQRYPISQLTAVLWMNRLSRLSIQ